MKMRVADYVADFLVKHDITECFTVTGGGAMLPGIDRLIHERTGLRVTRAKRPLESVCNGILRVIETEGEMGSLLHYRNR